MVIHYGRYEDGRLQAPSLKAQVLEYPAGTPLEFTVRKAVVRKTQPQNNYLHVLLSLAAKALNDAGYGDGTQWTASRVKAYCKQVEVFPVRDMVLPGGEVVAIPVDVRDMTKDEAGEAIDRVIGHFAELGIELPAPETQQELQLEGDERA